MKQHVKGKHMGSKPHMITYKRFYHISEIRRYGDWSQRHYHWQGIWSHVYLGREGSLIHGCYLKTILRPACGHFNVLWFLQPTISVRRGQQWNGFRKKWLLADERGISQFRPLMGLSPDTTNTLKCFTGGGIRSANYWHSISWFLISADGLNQQGQFHNLKAGYYPESQQKCVQSKIPPFLCEESPGIYQNALTFMETSSCFTGHEIPISNHVRMGQEASRREVKG